jgi:hypothetical protein
MKFSELWLLLANLSDESGNGNQLPLKVLYSHRNQPLLVPIGTQQAHYAVNFFIQNPILKYWGHLLIKLDYHLPFLRLLPIVAFESFPLTTLFGASSSDSLISQQGIAIFCGSPGALQKLTIYCPDSMGGLGKVAKVAVHVTANEAIIKEADWLEKLSHSVDTAKFIPHLLQHSSLNYHRQSLTMKSLPKGVSPKKFGTLHHRFLRVLAQQAPVFSEWKDSVAHTRLKHRFNTIFPFVDDDARLMSHEVISEIEHLTARSLLPNLMVHGDFAPWNLRQIDADLIVFDWEYAESYGNPLQDFLHFHLMPQALNRSGLNSKVMSKLLNQSIAYVDNQFGRDIGLSKAVGALTLHYLLDTITFYAEASGYIDYHHPVLLSYITMLQQRAQWLPKEVNSAIKEPLNLNKYENEMEIT